VNKLIARLLVMMNLRRNTVDDIWSLEEDLSMAEADMCNLLDDLDDLLEKHKGLDCDLAKDLKELIKKYE
jgi:hypothetical protein